MSSLPTRELERELVSLMPEASLHEVKIYLTSKDLEALEEIRGFYSNAMKNAGSNSEIFKKLIQIGREAVAEEKAKAERLNKKEPIRPTPDNMTVGMSIDGDRERETRASQNEETEKTLRTAYPARGSNGKASMQPSLVHQSRTPHRSSLKKEPTRKPPSPNPQAIPTAIKRAVFLRADYRCEFLYENGKRCGPRFFPPAEHIVPRADGGPNELSNLEALGRVHNLIRGIRTFGPAKMRRAQLFGG